jgi:hypothetical protein
MKAQLLKTTSHLYRAALEIESKIENDIAATEALIRSLAAQRGKGLDRAERIAKIAAGENHATSESIETKYANAVRKLADLKDAGEIAKANTAKVKQTESVKLLQSLQPDFQRLAKRFAEAAVVMHDTRIEMDELKSSLLGQGIGFHPIVCDFDLEAERVLGVSTDRASNFAILLRELVARGHLSKMPTELR